MLQRIKEIIESEFHIDRLIAEMNVSFKSWLEDEEMKQEFNELIKGKDYNLKFGGISIHYKPDREIFFRARLNIVTQSPLVLAYYEMEYDKNGKILDDFFFIT